MRAFVVEEFGKPGSVQDLEDPKPAGDELLVRVRAAGVNPFDAAVVNGYLADMLEHRFPLVPGVEFSGEVVQGPEGMPFAPGDNVYGNLDRDFQGAGTWAELVTVVPGNVSPKPGSVDHAAAAGVPTAGLTALEAIEASGLGEGQVLVIVGATGGVGSYATQLAALRGITVVAVARGANAGYARELGAKETIDYTAGDVVEQIRAAHPDGVDGLLDTYSDAEGIAGVSRAVREGGAVISVKGAADADALEGRRAINANRAGLDRLADMNRLFESGELKVPTTKTYSLEEANEAIAEVAGGHVRGKLALSID